MPRYELDGKFWEVSLDGSVVTTCSGTKQRRGVETPREHVDARAARRDYDALIETRTNAGYRLVVETITAGETGARNAALEAAIAAAPDEIEPYLVYADWLQSRGDPRGELITLQHAMRAAGNTEGFAKFRVHEEVLRERHAIEWLGERVVAAGARARFVWAMGFVDSAVLYDTRDPDQLVLPDLVAALLASTSGWLVRTLTLRGTVEHLRAAFEQLPSVRLRHVKIQPQGMLDDDVTRELAPEIMKMLNANVDVDLGDYAPAKFRWVR